jgi:4-diphosphocytidyl-2C-methyl-D-erythritol kinase
MLLKFTGQEILKSVVKGEHMQMVFISPVSQSRLFARDETASEIKEQRLGHKWLTRLLLQVHLDKQVPTGAGLGGGSGNAATALWAANQMNGNIASEKELQAWSAEIGSDCPFFFSQGAAYCTSRGEVNGYSHFSESNHLSILSFGCLEMI